jgi:hypothetical protein
MAMMNGENGHSEPLGYEIAVGTVIADRPPGGRGRSPAPRLPQNVACRFPALRSSEVASQRGDSLQLRVREIQLWSQQRKPLFDLLEFLPPDLPLPTPAAQHFAPVTFHGPMHPLQGPDVSGNAVVCIMSAEHLIEAVGLLPDRQVPHASHLVLQARQRAPQA